VPRNLATELARRLNGRPRDTLTHRIADTSAGIGRYDRWMHDKARTPKDRCYTMISKKSPAWDLLVPGPCSRRRRRPFIIEFGTELIELCSSD